MITTVLFIKVIELGRIVSPFLWQKPIFHLCCFFSLSLSSFLTAIGICLLMFHLCSRLLPHPLFKTKLGSNSISCVEQHLVFNMHDLRYRIQKIVPPWTLLRFCLRPWPPGNWPGVLTTYWSIDTKLPVKHFSAEIDTCLSEIALDLLTSGFLCLVFTNSDY